MERELDPAVVLEMLPQKIKNSERVLTEIRLDLSVLGTIDDLIDPAEVETLRRMERKHAAVLAEYERRLEAITAAANETKKDGV